MSEQLVEMTTANAAVVLAKRLARFTSIGFGRYFAQERRARYLSGKRAAEWLHVSRPTLSKLENGAKHWTDALATRAIELLEVKL